MPRETISSATDPYRVKVGWSHGRGVQIGVEGEGERSLFWLLLGNGSEAQATLGEQVRKLSELDYDDDGQRARALLDTLDTASHGGYAGVWSDLDRQGCNHLIRTLRRARDAAFGRDE